MSPISAVLIRDGSDHTHGQRVQAHAASAPASLSNGRGHLSPVASGPLPLVTEGPPCHQILQLSSKGHRIHHG